MRDADPVSVLCLVIVYSGGKVVDLFPLLISLEEFRSVAVCYTYSLWGKECCQTLKRYRLCNYWILKVSLALPFLSALE